MKKKSSFLINGAILTVLLFILDQLTKYLAKVFLAGNSGITVISGVFQLFYLENRGAAFGMLENRQIFFIVVAVLMSIAAVYIYCRLPLDKHYHLLRFICILIVSGSVGNMADRLIYGFVIDFLYFKLINFPVFNIADCYVCIGSALAALSILTVYRRDEFEFLFPKKEG